MLCRIKLDLHDCIQITYYPPPFLVRYPGLDLGRHTVAIHFQAAVYITQNQVNFTFGVVKTETDVLQTNLAVQSHVAQTGIAVFARSFFADTQTGQHVTAIACPFKFQVCANNTETVQGSVGNQGIEGFDIQGGLVNGDLGLHAIRHQGDTLQTDARPECFPFAVKTFYLDRLIKSLTQPGFQFGLVMDTIGHQQFAYAHDHRCQHCQQRQRSPQQCSDPSENFTQTVHWGRPSAATAEPRQTVPGCTGLHAGSGWIFQSPPPVQPRSWIDHPGFYRPHRLMRPPADGWLQTAG